MSTALRIVVADDEPDMREYFQKCLTRLGHQVVAVVDNGKELVERCRALRREAADLRQALEDRKVIERAKGVLMKRAQLDEPEAFRRLQKLASEKSRKLVDIAQMILVAEEAVGT